MIRLLHGLLVLAAIASAVSAQQERYAPLLDGLEPGESNRPSLEEILLDVGKLVRTADHRDAAVLERRLREVEHELGLLERLHQNLKSGVLVKVPEALLPKLRAAPDPAELELEREQVRRLHAELELRKRRAIRVPVLEEAPGDLARGGGVSNFGSAALAVEIEVPEPPTTEAGAPRAVARAVDPTGLAKALYRAGDFAGALNAIDSIAEDQRDAEILYRRARCLERLGRHDVAGEQYRAVVTADSKGFWGRQAEWMLRFGEKKFGTMDLMKRTAKGDPQEGN